MKKNTRIEQRFFFKRTKKEKQIHEKEHTNRAKNFFKQTKKQKKHEEEHTNRQREKIKQTKKIK